MKKMILILTAALCVSGFQIKAEAGTGSEIAGAVIGTTLCAGIITAAILDCHDHDRNYRHHRHDYNRDYRHHREHYSGRNHYRHHRCD